MCEILIVTANGMGIRFKQEDVRTTDRISEGVRGIRLAPGDKVISSINVKDGDKLFLRVHFVENGFDRSNILSQVIAKL